MDDSPRTRLAINVAAAIAIATLQGLGSPAFAGEGRWRLRIEPALVANEGHDQHVLTVHETETGPPLMDTKTAVTLDTDRKLTPGLQLDYERENWGLGAHFFIYGATVNGIHRTASGGGSIDEATFEIADVEFTSDDPSEVVFYDLLDDNRLEVWTFDLYATRTIGRTDTGSVEVQLGLRLGDFDDDYRAVAGIEDVEGTRVDASSNYPAMMGPLVGLLGDVRLGRHELRGSISQSVMLGEASLSAEFRHFVGPVSAEAFDVLESFETTLDVTIPVTELRADWTYHLGKHVGLGLGASASAWFDVPVPPGVVPGPGGREELHENTVIFTGLTAVLEWRF